jgi:hypothetical protein
MILFKLFFLPRRLKFVRNCPDLAPLRSAAVAGRGKMFEFNHVLKGTLIFSITVQGEIM